ncbi:NuA4 histone acetyltransferase subunit [Ascosphaera acerosa]|nr:NuA4 histone acetyltransferase subunit [Ascosphaera acerosa]
MTVWRRYVLVMLALRKDVPVLIGRADEVNAIILDPGYASTRAGFAGEDTPKSYSTTYYGKVPAETGERLVFGDNIFVPKPHLSIHNPFGRDGIVEDWDAATKIWEHAITSRLINPKQPSARYNGLNDVNDAANGDAMDVDPTQDSDKFLDDSPLLMTECPWNPTEAREKTIEIAMESWGTPAFFLARTAAMSAFSAGKASALVVDVGASMVSVTPVHDGLVLKRGIKRSHLGGDYISSQTRALLRSLQPDQNRLTPQYLIASRTAVESGQPPQVTLRDIPLAQQPADSFRRLHEERILTEFKESVARVWPGPSKLSHKDDKEGVDNEGTAKREPGRLFEFPDGYNQEYGIEGYRITEPLFDASAAIDDPQSSFAKPTPEQTIPELLRAALNDVDVDIRPHLLNNVVVTGATTLIPGFNDRLNSELVAMFPSPRVRLYAPGNTTERKFSSWVGGSILASLGTFHQMWISKKEYDDYGPSIVDRRCK